MVTGQLTGKAVLQFNSPANLLTSWSVHRWHILLEITFGAVVN